MKALLISEDREVAQHIKSLIESNFKKVELITAFTVEETMNLAASDGPFGFVFLNIDSKETDPNALSLELLDFIGERPFIFFGTEGVFKAKISDELFTSSEYNSSLFKPIARDEFVAELKEIIDKVKAWIKEETISESTGEIDPSDYVQMKLKTFFLYDKFQYDVHMAITPTSFMKLLAAGENYAHSTLNSYAKKGIKKLYILKDDQMKFLESEARFCLRVMSGPLNKEDIAKPYLVHLRSITVCHQYLNSLGPTLLCNELLDKLADSIIDQMKNSYSFRDILKNYPPGFGSIASKSLLTAFFSLELARAMGWDSDTTKLKLIVSSILQDYSLPYDELTWITDKDDPKLVEYDLETNQEFLNHPTKAAKMSAQFSKFSDIDFILANHQELPTREGFPSRPSLTLFTQVNAVFNIAQGVASRVDGDVIKQESLNKALKSMQKDFNSGVFKEPMKKISEIFKFN